MKRLAQILLIALLAFVLAIIGLTIYVKIQYPPERLKALLISYLAKEYGIRAEIEHLDFSLFSGFELDKTFIFDASLDSTLAPEWGPLAAIEKVKFAYRWRSLLSRRLDIDEISLSQPSLVYRQAPDRSSNLDALLAAFGDSTAATNDTAVANLPVSIQLKTFRIADLKIHAFLASAVDTQKILLGPINLEIDQIEVDRRANFSGRMKLQCDPANLSYASTPVGKGNALRLITNIESEINGVVRGDSVAATGELAVDHSRVDWGNSSAISLPRLSTRVEAKYDLRLSRLLVQDFRFSIEGKEQLAARFEMAMQDSVSALALNVDRGAFDLAQLLSLARTHTSGEIHALLQNMECAGVLEFSGSAFQRASKPERYQVALRGRDLSYADHTNGLKIEGGQLQVDWGTDEKEDSTTALTAQLSFAAFAVPMDSQTVLQTGPNKLAANLALAPNFLPRHGELNFSWENISGGKLSGHASIDQVKNSSQRGSWLSRTLGEAEIRADAVELAALSANAAAGKISGKLALSGKRLDELKLTCDLHSTPLTYQTEDGESQAPPYDAFASAKIRLDPALTRLALEDGSLQFKPDTAHNSSSVGFRANYDINKSVFWMDLTDAALDLAHIIPALPDTLFKGAEKPFQGVVKMQIAGGASANGWLQAFFSNTDRLNYSGKFVLQTDSAFYHDQAVGLKADRLQIDSQWSLTPNAIVGEYTVFCPAPEMPDYLKQPLPPTKASGKIMLEEKGFTITEGKIEIPNWHATGDYRVEGEFLPAGMQVKTTVDFGLHASAPITVDRGITLRGDAQTNFVFDQYFPDSLDAPQSARFSGKLKIDGLHVTVDTLLSLRDLNADCRFDQEFDLRDLSLKPSPASANATFANAGEALLMYEIFGNVRRENVMRKGVMREDVSGPSRITIGQIDGLGYQISDFAADLELGNGRFDIPKFSMKLFDGNWVGNLLVGLGNGNPDQINYATTMQISSLDVSYFRRLSAQLGKKSRISADFTLSGMGISPKKLEEVASNLSGKLNITKIENKVASNLLQVLDPNGTEKGIQNVRLLLKTGWNVEQLTFEMKNGFIYASLAHVKPWYAPFNLPQPLDFARIPVQPYIGNGAQAGR